VQTRFCRQYKLEIKISGAVELLNVVVCVTGKVDAESGMIVDLPQLDFKAQQAMQKIQQQEFSSTEELEIKLNSLLLPDFKNISVNCAIPFASSDRKHSLRIVLSGQNRFLEFITKKSHQLVSQTADLHFLKSNFKDFSELISDLEKNNWQGILVDPLQNIKIEIL